MVTNRDPGPGPGGLYDVARLAARLGVKPETLRDYVARRRVDWLPTPEGILNNGPVWAADRLTNIEQRRPTVGRPRKDAKSPNDT